MTAGEQLWLIDHAPIMGGAELFALKLARHAAGTTGVRVVVVCPPASTLAECCRAEGLALRTVAMPHFATPHAVRIPDAVMRLARLLRGAPRSAAVVASSAWSQALVAAAAPLLGGRPIVHLLHEQDTAKRASARLVLSRVGVPVAIGANAVRTYAAALGGAHVVQINNVLGDDELATAAAAPRRAASVSARRVPPNVGALGRFIADKGLLELVDELAVCRDDWAQAHLAGPAQDRAYAARVAQRVRHHRLTERIHLHGQTDGASFLDGLDTLIVPSTGTEGQPTVALEALARGAGVVMRAAIFSGDYRDLPVAPYHDGGDLAAALSQVGGPPPPLPEIARRFGTQQALDGLLAAARVAGASRAAGPGRRAGRR